MEAKDESDVTTRGGVVLYLRIILSRNTILTQCCHNLDTRLRTSRIVNGVVFMQQCDKFVTPGNNGVTILQHECVCANDNHSQ